MLYLHFAPSSDLLARLIADKIHSLYKDPFAPPRVIVPNPALGKWLQMRLAGERGCVANLPMLLLEKFLWTVLKPDANMRLLDVEHLRQVVCGLLEPTLLSQELYQPLSDYLKNPDTHETDPIKRVQLAARIAHQFLEYEYNRPSVWEEQRQEWKQDRPGMDAAWLSGRNYGASDAVHQAWQKDLYCKANRCLATPPEGALPATIRYISLPHLYRLRREKGFGPGMPWNVEAGDVFLFGVSKVSHFHRNALVEISQMQGTTMHLFLTNPCAEFWEDVDTSRSRKPRRQWNHASRSPEAGITARKPQDYNEEELSRIAHLPPDHPLLELWGGAGKENIFLWCPAAQWNFEYHSPETIESDAVPKTLLGALQYSLLRRQSTLPPCEGGFRDDGSLQVLSCPDRGREVEELRERILDLVHAGQLDQLNQAVVYLPDPAAYASQIQRVFGATRPGSPDHIPFTILATPGCDSVFAQGMQTFLEIAEGHFTRAQVFKLLRNPIVQASRSFTAGNVAVWEAWTEQLGIFRGLNRRHRQEMGDQGQALTDTHTFELGMARMLLGTLAHGAFPLDYHLFNDPAARPPLPPPLIPWFRDFNTADPDQLEKFCAAVQDLYDGLQTFRASAARGPAEALDVLGGLVWSWFGDLADVQSSSAEGRVRRDFLDSIQFVKMQQGLAGRAGIPLKELCTLIKSCLPAEVTLPGAAWVNGITFLPLKPATIVPHRAVFVLGLDARSFPGTSEKPSWDMLARKRIIGDSDPVRDNRFAFLELMHAAQERLVLSYQGSDMQKEEELQPASVVQELLTYLKNQGCVIGRKIPWIVHESLDAIRAAGRGHGSWDPVQLTLASLDKGNKRVGHRHDLLSRIKAAASEQKALTTDLSGLRKFFANPLEYHLLKTLGIELDDECASMGAQNEPLESDARSWAGLQKKIWTLLLGRVFPSKNRELIPDAAALITLAQKAARRLYGDHMAFGASPEAQLCLMEQEQLVQWAAVCAQKTLALSDVFPQHVLLQNSDLSLGRTNVPAEYVLTPQEGKACTLACRHTLALVPLSSSDAEHCTGILDFKKEGKAADNPDLWLAGMLQWLTEESLGQRPGARPCRDLRLVQLNRGDGSSKPVGFDYCRIKEQCSPGCDLHGWLKKFVTSMLVEQHSNYLPFRIIQELTRQSRELSLSGPEHFRRVTRETVMQKLADDHSPYVSYCKAFALTDARIPDMDDAALQELARSYFAPMLEGWLHD